MTKDNFILLDGGVGTEIERLGITPDPSCWSALANLKNPDIVEKVHSSYLDAGADVLTTNTMMAGRHVLEFANIDEFEKCNRGAVKAAKKAILNHSHNKDIKILGSVCTFPPLDCAHEMPKGKTVAAGIQLQIEILLSEGVDGLIVEQIIEIESGIMSLEECKRFDVPVWAGVSAMKSEHSEDMVGFRQPNTLERCPPNSLASLLKSVAKCDPDYLGIVHTNSDRMTAALSVLKEIWYGKNFAKGLIGSANAHRWNSKNVRNGPDQYARQAISWLHSFDLTAIGGCCGTTPKDISAIRKLAPTL